jgi:DNA-directed RNA polymerase subunit RPC12/RpoP
VSYASITQPVTRRKEMKDDEYICAYCGKEITDFVMHPIHGDYKTKVHFNCEEPFLEERRQDMARISTCGDENI